MRRNGISDLRGAGRLAAELTVEVAEVVEQMHATIGRVTFPIGRMRPRRTWGLTRLTYGCIRAGASLVGRGLDVALEPLEVWRPVTDTAPARDAVVAALNGVLGDRLEATGNPLGIVLQLVEAASSGPAVVFVHGLCMNEAAFGPAWSETVAGFGQPLRVRYNSGRAVAANGRDLSARLEAALEGDVVLVGHSMGGLVARSAVAAAEAAGHSWRQRLKGLVTLGTPHLGAPLERGGQWLSTATQLSPYSAPIIELLDRRSAGIHDLARGAVVEPSRHIPLPSGVACFAVAACLEAGPLVGDGLVPVASALGQHRDPAAALGFRATWTGEMGHNTLLVAPEVREVVGGWLDQLS